ncbi:hypothetical protein KIL84_020594 [Mauremys mutica]|uniref:Uncharacterized protein n=1 Tax=Mauremys mutica TaxID=74926 RepID=A0A9D4BBP4_9SAUR|nr:hypothetical protein KIL84_020594 [Mauremys mutica]
MKSLIQHAACSTCHGNCCFNQTTGFLSFFSPSPLSSLITGNEIRGQRKKTTTNQYRCTETLLESFITAYAPPRYDTYTHTHTRIHTHTAQTYCLPQRLFKLKASDKPQE